MRLVIAEKPSLARSIAEAIGATGRSGGALVGGGWTVVACRGHLLELRSPDDYEGRGWGRPWDAGQLPMLPEEMPLSPSEEDGAAEALAAIRRELGRDDLEEVVHAGDADREGEGIVRRVLEWCPVDVPVTRLWARSTEPDELRRAMDERRPDSDYDGLGDAARGRAELDWLVGLNVTRALTCLYGNGRVVHAGRVLTPVLRLVAERTRQRARFRAVPFWVCRAEAAGVAFEGPRRDSRDGARRDAEAVGAGPLVVTGVEAKTKRTRPPLLHDILTLEQQASRVLGLKPKECDDALQALYEAGLVTYPRTDSRVISESELPDLEALLGSGLLPGLAGAADGLPYDPDPSRVVGQTGGHSALMPTSSLTPAAMGRLPKRQAELAGLVCARVLAACCPVDCVERKVTARAEAAGVTLSWSGSVELEAGWRAVERACGLASGLDGPKPLLPGSVGEGSALPVSSTSVREGATEPPKAYTTETLLSAMEHADRLVEGEDGEALKAQPTHSGGLGTPATRSETISRLEALGYVEFKGRSVFATSLGLAVDAMAPSQLASVRLTAAVERALEGVESGREPLGAFRASAREWASSLVSSALRSRDPGLALPAEGPGRVGACPRCGADVVASRTGTTYRCSSQRGHWDGSGYVVDDPGCGFWIGTVCGRALSPGQAVAILAGRSVPLSGLRSKSGRTFSARARLDPEGGGGVALDFVDGKGSGRARRGGGRQGGRGKR